jgi:hypothetical protein
VWVEWRAAADIEVAYFERQDQFSAYPMLNQRANDAWIALLAAMEVTDTGAIAADPVWQMPRPFVWGDQSPGSAVTFPVGPV